jgi:hypothetical protein
VLLPPQVFVFELSAGGVPTRSSGGRKAAFIAGLALGIVMPPGQPFMTAGAVDLATGDRGHVEAYLAAMEQPAPTLEAPRVSP